MGSVPIRLTDSLFSDAKALLVAFSDVSVHKADPEDWKTIPLKAVETQTSNM